MRIGPHRTRATSTTKAPNPAAAERDRQRYEQRLLAEQRHRDLALGESKHAQRGQIPAALREGDPCAVVYDSGRDGAGEKDQDCGIAFHSSRDCLIEVGEQRPGDDHTSHGGSFLQRRIERGQRVLVHH